jgi:hypothetical protein
MAVNVSSKTPVSRLVRSRMVAQIKTALAGNQGLTATTTKES